MSDFFRVKVVSKRQVTMPQLLLDKLRIKEGDELEFEVEGNAIVAVHPMKLVPTTFFSERILKKLEERGARATEVSAPTPTKLPVAEAVEARAEEGEQTRAARGH